MRLAELTGYPAAPAGFTYCHSGTVGATVIRHTYTADDGTPRLATYWPRRDAWTFHRGTDGVYVLDPTAEHA